MQPFCDIWVLSNLMKGGINYSFRNPNYYYKGHIFKYFTPKESEVKRLSLKENTS